MGAGSTVRTHTHPNTPTHTHLHTHTPLPTHLRGIHQERGALGVEMRHRHHGAFPRRIEGADGGARAHDADACVVLGFACFGLFWGGGGRGGWIEKQTDSGARAHDAHAYVMVF